MCLVDPFQDVFAAALAFAAPVIAPGIFSVHAARDPKRGAALVAAGACAAAGLFALAVAGASPWPFRATAAGLLGAAPAWVLAARRPVWRWPALAVLGVAALGAMATLADVLSRDPCAGHP